MANKKVDINDVLTPFMLGKGNLTPGQQVEQQEPNILEIAKGLGEELFSNKNLAIKTRLNERQIYATTLVQLWARATGNKLVGKVIDDFMTMQISNGGKSRSEYVNLISKAISGYSEIEQTKDRSTMQHLLGID